MLTPIQHKHNILLISARQTYTLRHEVLRSGLPASAAIFEGDEAPETFHLGVVADGQLVAVASVFHQALPQTKDDKFWQLRGMAVAPAWQRQGYGAALVHEAVRHVAEQDGTHLWCNARVEAMTFYQRLGFEICSEQFEIEDAGPHVRMMCPVA